AGRDQPRKRGRVLSARLRVADPELDRPEVVVGPNAPPELSVLLDRVDRYEELGELGIGIPAAERLVHAAAGEAPREDLRPRRVKARVAAVEERRVCRHGEQVRQQRAQVVAYGDRAVGAAYADVDVKRERVVAPCHVLEPILAAAV